jgi:hypothetical protein
MRIDPNPGTGGPGAPTRTETPADTPAANKAESAGRGDAPGDRVEVSDGVRRVQRIVADALRETGTTLEIRHDVVERARQLLDSDRVGRDSEKLASAIIDDLVYRP